MTTLTITHSDWEVLEAVPPTAGAMSVTSRSP